MKVGGDLAWGDSTSVAVLKTTGHADSCYLCMNWLETWDADAADSHAMPRTAVVISHAACLQHASLTDDISQHCVCFYVGVNYHR